MKPTPIAVLALLALLCPLLTSGCNTYFPVNDPISDSTLDHSTGYRGNRRWSSIRSNEILPIVAFSGGGTRAASFAYGVLEGLNETRVVIDGREVSLLDEIDHVTGVSGGSFTAAYLGLHGCGIFEDFEQRFLRRDVQGALIGQLLAPWNWALLASPFFERSDLIARYYDRILFDGATFADLAAREGPLIQINAADLATYPISRAVAASSAVPGPMSPLTLRNFAGRCGFESPAWIRDAIASRRTFSRSYVNAATAPEVAWEALDEAPALFDIIDQTTTVQINRYMLETIELLRSTFESWQEVAARWPDPVERLYLNGLPTSFRLGDQAVDWLVAAGRQSLVADPAFRRLIEALESHGPRAD